MDYVYLLDDKWWLAVWHNWSFMMLAMPVFIGSVLKLIARFHPGVPCDDIMGLFQVWFTKPGSSPVVETHSVTSITTDSSSAVADDQK